ncbi:MAG TPA: nitrous oxide reductase family maturation protein NosD, partial [Thauera sp.]|nr:nitrous oxide reductase family maturation protein NosD [Thauera sp.]
MSILNKLTLLATAMGLALAAAPTQATDDDRDSGRGPGSTADFSTAPRVDVHKPVAIIPLYLRDKRIHG